MENFLTSIHPAILVGTVYLAVLLPTYLLLKKYKPTYWWMVLGLFGSNVFINLIIFCSIFITKGNLISISFFIFGSLISFILYVSLPLLLISFRKKDKLRSAFFAYVFSGFGFLLVWGEIYYLMALSMQAWIGFFN